MTEETTYDHGIALIVEGATERVFYAEFVENRARFRNVSVARVADGDGTNFAVSRADGTRVLVKFNNVGTVTQMTNSAEWFLRSCAARHAGVDWSVFLSYDTDAYNSNVTKFHQGDWARLRKNIERGAKTIVDLAAEADIEDIMLCDYAGILAFLGLPESTPMPSGRKGKVKMRKLHQALLAVCSSKMMSHRDPSCHSHRTKLHGSGHQPQSYPFLMRPKVRISSSVTSRSIMLEKTRNPRSAHGVAGLNSLFGRAKKNR